MWQHFYLGSGKGLYTGNNLGIAYKLKARMCQSSLTGVKGQVDAVAGGEREGEG